MIRRPPRSTLSSSSAASDVYKPALLVCARWSAWPILPQPDCSLPIPALRLMLAETIGQTARAISATLLVLALVTTCSYPDLSIPCRSLSENMGLRPLRLGTTDHQKVAGSGSNLP